MMTTTTNEPCRQSERPWTICSLIAWKDTNFSFCLPVRGSSVKRSLCVGSKANIRCGRVGVRRIHSVDLSWWCLGFAVFLLFVHHQVNGWFIPSTRANINSNFQIESMDRHCQQVAIALVSCLVA